MKGMRRREGRLREQGQSRRKCGEEEKTKKKVEEEQGMHWETAFPASSSVKRR